MLRSVPQIVRMKLKALYMPKRNDAGGGSVERESTFSCATRKI